MEVVRLTREGTKRARGRHPWIFSNELESGFANLPAGEIVEIRGSDNRCYGVGLLSPNSLIAIRRYSLKKDSIDGMMLQARIREAIARRSQWFPGETVYRLVYGEADDLPGMLIDRYGEILVIQVLITGIQRLLDVIVSILVEELRPTGILAQYDSAYREQESLPVEPAEKYGKVPSTITITQDGLSLEVDNWNGHKTGFYLDQLPARKLTMAQAKDKSVLDLFCYSGGFSLYAAAGSADRILGVDKSQEALKLAKKNAMMNGFQDRCQWENADVFDFVKIPPKEPYDFVVMDPPSLVKNRRTKMSGLRAYRDLNARAMEWVKPGGKLLTSSCSGLVDHQEFFQVLGEAAVKAEKQIRLMERIPQSLDHPIQPDIPQTEYLKVYLLEVS